MRIIFMGTPHIACPFLEYLACHENVVGVFTAKDAPVGRHMRLKHPPIKDLALSHSIEVVQLETLLQDDAIEEVKALAPDLIVVVAYGYKIPDSILTLPKYGCINLHFSLLPKYRGAAPVNWAIAKGETETGVTSFYLSNKMDAGDCIYQEDIPINENDTTELILEHLVPVGISVLKHTLYLIRSNKIEAKKQQSLHASTAPKLKKTDGHINWHQSNLEIHNLIRGFYPWPGSYTFKKESEIDNELIKVFDSRLPEKAIECNSATIGEIIEISKDKGILVKCAQGCLWLQKLQLAGHKKVDAYDFFVGRKIQKGDIFES